MNTTNNITKRMKHKHLSLIERTIIQIRIKDKWAISEIAKELNCSRGTIYNELKRGTVTQIKGVKEVQVYFPDTGQLNYESNRKNSKKPYKRLNCTKFINEVNELMVNKKWSVDASVGYLKSKGKYKKEEVVSTKTIYSYIDKNLMTIKNIDLPLKLRRSPKKTNIRKHLKKLGNSIEERSIDIEKREEFGHWEIDTVIGIKSKEEPVLVTLVERKSRYNITLKAERKNNESILGLLDKMYQILSSDFKNVFKTITSDNGLEFSQLTKVEEIGTRVYYAHPYSSYERGSNEKHNGMIRRFIPKGKKLTEVSNEKIKFVSDWCNTLPRKILKYKSPLEIFINELEIMGVEYESVQFDIAI